MFWRFSCLGVSRPTWSTFAKKPQDLQHHHDPILFFMRTCVCQYGGFLNWDTPKSSTLKECFFINLPFWGTPTLANHHIRVGRKVRLHGTHTCLVISTWNAYDCWHIPFHDCTDPHLCCLMATEQWEQWIKWQIYKSIQITKLKGWHCQCLQSKKHVSWCLCGGRRGWCCCWWWWRWWRCNDAEMRTCMMTGFRDSCGYAVKPSKHVKTTTWNLQSSRRFIRFTDVHCACCACALHITPNFLYGVGRQHVGIQWHLELPTNRKIKNFMDPCGLPSCPPQHCTTTVSLGSG